MLKLKFLVVTYFYYSGAEGVSVLSRARLWWGRSSSAAVCSFIAITIPAWKVPGCQETTRGTSRYNGARNGSTAVRGRHNRGSHGIVKIRVTYQPNYQAFSLISLSVKEWARLERFIGVSLSVTSRLNVVPGYTEPRMPRDVGWYTWQYPKSLCSSLLTILNHAHVFPNRVSLLSTPCGFCVNLACTAAFN